CVRQGGAVYWHEGTPCAAAGGMNRTRDQFLSRSTFAVDEDVRGCRRDLTYQFANPFHRRALADNRITPKCRWRSWTNRFGESALGTSLGADVLALTERPPGDIL